MKFKKLIIILVGIAIFAALTYYNAFYVNPYQLKVREEYINNTKLDESFDGFTIVYFSDLHYGVIDDNFLNETVDKINMFDPDLILFGGDLVDHYSNNPLNDEKRATLTAALKSLEAKYGKFAVLGNHDLDSENTKNAITNILNDADFDVLTNESIDIHNDSSASFNLIGIDSLSLGNPDINAAYQNVDENSFNLAICHTPDIFDDIPSYNDYLLAGHSHGGQIRLPIIGPLYTPKNGHKYVKGYYDLNGTSLYVTSGIGVSRYNFRLFNKPEINFYRLNKEANN